MLESKTEVTLHAQKFVHTGSNNVSSENKSINSEFVLSLLHEQHLLFWEEFTLDVRTLV